MTPNFRKILAGHFSSMMLTGRILRRSQSVLQGEIERHRTGTSLPVLFSCHPQNWLTIWKTTIHLPTFIDVLDHIPLEAWPLSKTLLTSTQDLYRKLCAGDASQYTSGRYSCLALLIPILNSALTATSPSITGWKLKAGLSWHRIL